MSVPYMFTKAPPINFPVLTNQINADVNIGVQVVDLNYDAGSQTLIVDMASTLTAPQQTELGTVVANHNGITKDFSIPFPTALYDDFITATSGSALGWTSTVATSGSFINGNQSDANHPGIVRIGTGNLVTGAAGYHLGLHDILLGGGEINLEFGLRLNQLGGVGNQFNFRVGLGDTAINTISNGCWVEYSVGNSPNWSVIASNAGVQTVITSTTPADIGWHTFSLQISADGTTCLFFVDDAYISTISTNMPTNSCGPVIQLIKTVGTNPINVDIDFFYMLAQNNRV